MRNHRRPTSLMRSATSAAGVPFVILVEENMFAEVWILLHLVMVSQRWTSPFFVFTEKFDQSIGDFFRGILKRDHIFRSGWTFNFKVVAVILVKSKKTFDDQEIDWEPNRTAPITVTPKRACCTFARAIAHGHACSIMPKHIRIIFKCSRH